MRGPAHKVSPAASEAHRLTAPHKQKGRGQQGASTREQRPARLPPLTFKTWGSQDTALDLSQMLFNSTSRLTDHRKHLFRLFPNITYP